MAREPADVLTSRNGIAWTRRALLGTLAGLFCVAGWDHRLQAQGPESSEQDSSTETVSLEWQLPRRYADRTAAYLGVDADHIRPAPGSPTERGAPILVIIVAAVLLVTLARAIVSAYRDFRYGGIIIQDTPRGLSIRHDRSIPGHVIIIKDRHGITVRELRGDDVNVRDLAPLLANARANPA